VVELDGSFGGRGAGAAAAGEYHDIRRRQAAKSRNATPQPMDSRMYLAFALVTVDDGRTQSCGGRDIGEFR
jgi:hypothetical protein